MCVGAVALESTLTRPDRVAVFGASSDKTTLAGSGLLPRWPEVPTQQARSCDCSSGEDETFHGLVFLDQIAP